MIYLLSASSKEGTIHLPMITFKLIEQELDLSGYDMLMFTSKQAVKSAESINVEWKKLPCLAIGEATTKQITALGGKVIHQAKDFYAKRLNYDIVSKFKTKKILYLRPEEVSFDSKSFLAKEGILLEEKILYKTYCVRYSKAQAPLRDSIIIFTSPSTIKCFLKNFDWDESYIAIVIGEATKVHLPKNVQFRVADKPLIDACIKKAKEII